jgi:tripartite-type tricarboxylate transporter receptor subunit TctC
MKLLRLLVGTAIALWLPLCAQAQYPEKPVRIVVAYPPGGVVDILARTLAVPLQKVLKESVIVENRAGAGGVVGHGLVAKAAPDGYTLLLAAAGPLISTKMYKNVPYDPVKDYTAIAMVGETNIVLVASDAFKGARTLGELVDYAKANPGKVNLSINSVGSMHHLMSELFMLRAGIKLNRVPYKGAGQVMPDLLAGVVDLHMESLPLIAAHIKSGRLHPLAAAYSKRLDELPGTPTFAELGYPDINASPWYAFIAPAGLPQNIVARLNNEINALLADPEIKEQFAKRGANIVRASPEETARFIHAEIERVGRIVDETGARME